MAVKKYTTFAHTMSFPLPVHELPCQGDPKGLPSHSHTQPHPHPALPLIHSGVYLGKKAHALQRRMYAHTQTLTE